MYFNIHLPSTWERSCKFPSPIFEVGIRTLISVVSHHHEQVPRRCIVIRRATSEDERIITISVACSHQPDVLEVPGNLVRLWVYETPSSERGKSLVRMFNIYSISYLEWTLNFLEPKPCGANPTLARCISVSHLLWPSSIHSDLCSS